jgi:hypothetical protein
MDLLRKIEGKGIYGKFMAKKGVIACLAKLITT